MRIVVFVGSPVEADDKDVSWIYKFSFFILGVLWKLKDDNIL